MKKGLKIFGITVLIVIFAGITVFGGFVLFFPIKFNDYVEICAKNQGVDSSLIYAVIKAESNFKEDAISSKGAVGLMQILPTTAVSVATELGIENFNSTDLFDAETNILIGTRYLKYLLNKFQNTETAICCYNAGEFVVQSWLNNSNYSADQISLKEIPYAETQNFLNKVNLFNNVYKKRLVLPF